MEYNVDADIIMSKQFLVDAENEEEAKRIVNKAIESEPAFWSHQGNYVTHVITDVMQEP